MAPAQSGQSGNVCVHQFAAGATCEGSDVVAISLRAVQVVEPCGPGGWAKVVLDLTLSAVGAPSSFDVGAFVAQNGDSALSGGHCWHDYLEPPLTTTPVYGDHDGNTVPDLRNGPWPNLEPFVPNDDCGDIEGDTELIASLATETIPLDIACVDEDEDGTVDVSVCAGWRSGNQGVCNGLSDAVPGSNERCHCTRLDVIGLPEPGAAWALTPGAALLGLLRRRRAANR